MGLSAVGALIAIALAFLAQSPRLLTRLNMAGQRLDMRARTLTGYGLALLLLAMGFFVAGVPLDAPPAAVAAATDDAPATVETPGAGATITATVPVGGQSGAMVGLPTSSAASDATAGLPTVDLSAVAVVTGTVEVALTPGAATATPTVVAGSGGTPTAEATATLFPTATPTLTPSPTLTPTPIAGPTARIGDETSTLPVRRLPGNDEPVLAVLVRGEIILPLSGHAFHTGDVWREISTVAGIIGWVPEQFLVFEEEEQ